MTDVRTILCDNEGTLFMGQYRSICGSWQGVHHYSTIRNRNYMIAGVGHALLF